ncbi:MAG: LamG domain-containing protein, partial [Patescibacteria group bacterium]|nr:LamG domain-containing protein [Patescibacteria group bacterium]
IEMSSGVEKFLVTKYGIVDMTIGSLTPDTRWHNAVLVFSSTNGTTVYQDGVQVGNDTGTTNLANNYSGFVIGKSLDTTPVYFNGAIDDVRSYHRVLSAAEIGQLYHAGHNQQSVSQVGPANLNSGLVGWWTFDGKNTNWGTGVTNDSSGNGNSGHLIGMSTTTSITEGKIGQALMFPGTGSSYVTKTSFSGDTSKGGSASFWVKLKSYVDFGAALVSNNIGVDIYFRSSPAIQLTNRDSNGNTVASIFDTTNIPPLNRWSLVTVTWDSSATKYYLNGALIDTSAGTTTYQTLNGDTIYIGNDRNSSGRTINGSIDDVRVYNRALSAQEVQQLYNSTR